MKVNIITHQDGWILDKFAKELQNRLPYVVLNKKNFNSYDINYYVNYCLFKGKSSKIDIAWFTHVEENIPSLKKKFFDVANQVDYCVCHAKKYADILIRSGIKNVKQIVPGIDTKLYSSKLILGYVGRFYKYTNRKNRKLLEKLLKLDFIELRTTEGGYSEEELPNFYRQLDYVIIPSRIEGGPMCLLEGLACGIPIIAPKNVGMVSEFKQGIHHYKNSNIVSLKKLLKKLYNEKLKLRKQVEHLTWARFAREHDVLFKKILKK